MKAENIQDIYELSPTQQGILFHSLYSPESGVYFVQLCFTLRGSLNVEWFQRAWQQVVARHTVLHTSFYWENLDKPLQVVHQQVNLPFVQYDWRGMAAGEQQKRLEAFLESDRKQGFDLSQAPLMRLTLIRVAEDSYQLVWSKHHLILDGWSTALVFKDVVEHYQALCQGQDLPLAPSRTYGDYIAWLQQQDLSKAEKFWRQALNGIQAPTPLISLKVDISLDQKEEYDEQQIKLSAETTTALQSLARQHQLTLNTVVQGAWALLLSRYSGESDVVYGNTVSGRPVDLVGAESMVGLFINTLPVRVTLDAEQSLLIWLQQLQTQLVEMRQYEYSPLVEVQGWSEVPRGVPLFDSLVVFENYPVDRAVLEGQTNLEIQINSSFDNTNYPLTVTVLPGSELAIAISYDRRRFDEATITRMLGHFQTLLQGMVTSPDGLLKDLPLLSEAEKHQLLVEWNDTAAEYPQDQCIHQLFEAQVEKTPDAVAVSFEGEQLTYRELNQRANQLAHYLQQLGVGSEVLVGICVERSLEMIVGLVGILKAGGAYVPLDPAYPQERLAFILSDSQTSILLTQQKFLEKLPAHQGRVLCLDTHWERNSPENPANVTTCDRIAYVIYTSGSTGKPKGVQIPHSAVVNFLKSMQRQPGLTQSDVLLAVTTISFDIAALELYLPLITGARVLLVSREVATDGKQLSEQIEATGATVMQATPGTWQMLLAVGWQGSPQLKILCGGEALPYDLATQLLAKGAAVWNLYGPTETTIWSTVYPVKVSQRSKSFVPIGRPIANTQVYLLDSQGQPVPIGIPGELHIGGAGLARGYLNRPELTAAKFIFHPNWGRLYKTGDLARYLPDGTMDYLGRTDDQVKLRGFRIELGEIETVLKQHPVVRQAVVAVREDKPGNKHLVAYLVLQVSFGDTLSELRHFVGEKLPNYMVPSAFVQLESLPLTPNGKVDRRALPAPDRARFGSEKTFALPRTPIEEVLAGIWAQVLGCESVSIHDNFFDLGGHSLLATQVMGRLRSILQVELPLRCLFESPTIAELAESIEATMKAGQNLKAPPIVTVPRDGKLPLSFAQERLWLVDRLEPNNTAYNMPAALRLVGSLNIAALEQSFNEIVRRHEVLRTSFTEVNGQPVQAIAPSLTLKIPVVDLQALPETERDAEVLRLAAQETQLPFDLAWGPLLRVTLLKLGLSEHVLLLTMHHIVSDAWSNGVFIRELAALYEAFCTGQPSPLPELSIQYADFAHWQRQWLQGEVLETLLSYWQRQLAGAPPKLDLKKIAGEPSLPHIPRDTSPPAPLLQGEGSIAPPFPPLRGSKLRREGGLGGLGQPYSSRIATLPARQEKDTTQSFALSANLSEKLKTLSCQEGTTLFMTLLAAFQTLLYRYTQQDDIVIGTDVANRNRAETEPLIGFFINLLVLRTNLSGNPSFRELLGRVREVALGAYAHQDLPFAKLVEALQPDRTSSHTPLFQVLFVLQNAPMPALKLPDLTLNFLEVNTGKAKFDLALFMEETEQGLIGYWKYNTELLNYSAIARLSGHLETLLSSIVKNPDTRIDTLEMLSETEKQKQLAEQTRREKANFNKFKTIKPKAVSLPQRQLIKTTFLQPGQSLPLVIEPDSDEIDLADWAASNREFIETQLLKQGAILFRGFNTNSVPEFEKVANVICPNLFGEYGDLPREGVSGKVYGSTPYPPDQAILFHNESSHLHRWPLKIWFFCVQPARQGGETPILDCRKVYEILNPKLRERFEQKQLMYVRNYIEGLDVSWQDFFHTTNKVDVEAYCHQARIKFEWLENNGLKTCKICPAVAKHPKTGNLVFFNQLQLHHVSCLDPGVRQSLLSVFGEDKLPRNVYYGDGTPIEDSVMEEIGAVYRESEISFSWQQGDILMLDNMLTAHGRNAYVGSRKIVVAMGELMTGADV
jgi:amino acid adenylation domain-containing protein